MTGPAQSRLPFIRHRPRSVQRAHILGLGSSGKSQASHDATTSGSRGHVTLAPALGSSRSSWSRPKSAERTHMQVQGLVDRELHTVRRRRAPGLGVGEEMHLLSGRASLRLGAVHRGGPGRAGAGCRRHQTSLKPQIHVPNGETTRTKVTVPHHSLAGSESHPRITSDNADGNKITPTH